MSDAILAVPGAKAAATPAGVLWLLLGLGFNDDRLLPRARRWHWQGRGRIRLRLAEQRREVRRPNLGKLTFDSTTGIQGCVSSIALHSDMLRRRGRNVRQHRLRAVSQCVVRSHGRGHRPRVDRQLHLRMAVRVDCRRGVGVVRLAVDMSMRLAVIIHVLVL